MGHLEKLGNIDWKDAVAIDTAITQKIPKLVASDDAYQNAQERSDPENMRIEGELAIKRAIAMILSDYIELFQQFTQNAEFRKRLTSLVLAQVDGR
jgi:type I restriction enzyme R subunit